MILKFEPRGLQLFVICGPGEEYKPTPEILELHKKLDEARTKLAEKEEEIQKFNTEYLEPIATEVQEVVKDLNLKLNPQAEENQEE